MKENPNLRRVLRVSDFKYHCTFIPQRYFIGGINRDFDNYINVDY